MRLEQATMLVDEVFRLGMPSAGSFLRDSGFKRYGWAWMRKPKPGLSQVVEIEVRRAERAAFFTVDLGVKISAVSDALKDSRGSGPDWTLKTNLGHFSRREDAVWWALSSAKDALPAAREVLPLLMDHGVPFLDPLKDEAAVEEVLSRPDLEAAYGPQPIPPGVSLGILKAVAGRHEEAGLLLHREILRFMGHPYVHVILEAVRRLAVVLPPPPEPGKVVGIEALRLKRGTGALRHV